MNKKWWVLGMVLLASIQMFGCGGGDDSSGASHCQEACNIVADMCGSSGSDCESQCAADSQGATQAQIDAAMNCLRAATTCAETQACIP